MTRRIVRLLLRVGLCAFSVWLLSRSVYIAAPYGAFEIGDGSREGTPLLLVIIPVAFLGTLVLTLWAGNRLIKGLTGP